MKKKTRREWNYIFNSHGYAEHFNYTACAGFLGWRWRVVMALLHRGHNTLHICCMGTAAQSRDERHNLYSPSGGGDGGKAGNIKVQHGNEFANYGVLADFDGRTRRPIGGECADLHWNCLNDRLVALERARATAPISRGGHVDGVDMAHSVPRTECERVWCTRRRAHTTCVVEIAQMIRSCSLH